MDIQENIKADGGILVRVQFLDAAGGVSLDLDDAVVTDVLVGEGKIVYIKAGSDRLHWNKIDSSEDSGFETVLVCDSGSIRLRLSPIYLPEQSTAARAWATLPVVATMRKDMKGVSDAIQG